MKKTLLSVAVAAASLSVHAETMPEITVTASRFETSIASAPVNVTVIDADTIANSSAQNLADVLKRQTSVKVSELFGITGGKASVDMGGFGPSGSQNTLLLLNGRRLNDVDLSGANLADIPLSSIERIEIIQGSSTVLYGDNATSGVINIITKSALAAQPVTATARIGSFNTRQLTLSGGMAGEKDGFNFSADTLKSDGYRDNSAFNTTRMHGEWSHLSGEDLYGIRVSGNRDSSELPGALNEPLYEDDPTQATFSIEEGKQNGHSIEAFFSGTHWAGELAYRSKHQEATVFGDSEADLKTLSLTPRWQHAVNGHQLVAGIDLYRSGLDARGDFGFAVNESDTTRNSYALYVTDTMTISDKVELGLGARAQRVSLDLENRDLIASTTSSDSSSDSLSAWDATLRHRHEGGFTYVRLARSFRFPVLDEMWNYFSGGIDLLDPQTGRHVEFGLNHQLDNGSHFKLTWFMMDLEDEIGFDIGTYSNVNFDPTRHEGVDVQYNTRLGRSVDLTMGYSYRDATFTDGPNDGKHVPEVPRHKANLALDYALSDHQGLGLEALYTGSRYFGDDYANEGKKMPVYTVLDASYRHSWDDWQLKLTVKNLTDEQYADRGYYANYLPNPYNYYPLPGRNYSLSVSKQF